MKKNFFILLIIACTSVFPQSEGKISGVVFMDYFYNAARDTGISSLSNTVLGGNKDANGFDLRRAYFTYDHKLSDDFSTRFRLEADGRSLTDNRKIGVFVKDAFLKWKDILPGNDLIAGIQPPPAYEVSESYYGFRSLEKTIMDLRGIVSSRDFGVSMKGRITSSLGYWLMYGNSSGNSPESDRYKRAYAHIHITPVQNLSLTLYGDIKFKPAIDDPFSEGTLSNNTITAAVFIGYTDQKTYSIGTETFYQVNENNYVLTSEVSNINALGVSLFGWYRFAEALTATVRFDLFDPAFNEDLKNDARNYIIAGLSWRPVKNAAIIPNVLIETYEDLPRRSIDASVTPRITLTYEFQ